MRNISSILEIMSQISGACDNILDAGSDGDFDIWDAFAYKRVYSHFTRILSLLPGMLEELRDLDKDEYLEVFERFKPLYLKIDKVSQLIADIHSGKKHPSTSAEDTTLPPGEMDPDSEWHPDGKA